MRLGAVELERDFCQCLARLAGVAGSHLDKESGQIRFLVFGINGADRQIGQESAKGFLRESGSYEDFACFALRELSCERGSDFGAADVFDCVFHDFGMLSIGWREAGCLSDLAKMDHELAKVEIYFENVFMPTAQLY